MFKLKYALESEIPAEVRYLYQENAEGEFELIAQANLRAPEDVSRVQEALRKERADHKVVKQQLSLFNNLDPEEVQIKLDRIEELEAASGGNIDETKLSKLVEVRLRSKVAPLERQIATLTGERDTFAGKVGEFEAKDVKRTIHDNIRKAATVAKVRDTAIEDALMAGGNVFEVNELGNVVTKDNVGVTPGIDATVWLTEMKTARPHWWPETKGVGAKGGQGGFASNPFTAENWNITEQGALVKTDRARADQLALSAGTTVGGPKPTA